MRFEVWVIVLEMVMVDEYHQNNAIVERIETRTKITVKLNKPIFHLII